MVRQQIEIEELMEKNHQLEEANEELVKEGQEKRKREEEGRFNYFNGKVFTSSTIQQLELEEKIKNE